MKRIWRIHGLTLFWAAVIFTVSSIPSLKTPDVGISSPDLLAHALEFGVFGYLLRQSFQAHNRSCRHAVVFAILIGTVYAMLDEYHQSFVPGREAAWSDILADIAGVILAQCLFHLNEKKKKAYNK